MTTKDSYQLTIWASPHEEMRTQFFDRGTYGNYLHHEMGRLQDKGIESWCEQNKTQVKENGYVFEKGEAIALFTTAGHVKPV